MYEQFTDRARRVMRLANQEARRFRHEDVGTEHILLGLIREGSGAGATVLKNLGVDLLHVFVEVEKLSPSGPAPATESKRPQTPRARKAVEHAMNEARSLKHEAVGTEHLLLGLLCEEEGAAAQMLMNLGVTLDEARAEVRNLAARRSEQRRAEYHVVITDFITDDLKPERRVLGQIAEVTALDARDEEQLVGRIEQADAIILYHYMSLSQKTLERLEHCKLIVRGGVGVDNIDRELARQRGIPVANVPDYGSEEVADTAIAMMLTLARGVHVMSSRGRDGQGPWSYEQVVPLVRLRGRGFGVIGLGRIGTAAALRAKALGMDVVFYDPYKPDGYDKALGIRRVETLGELLAQSLVVSVHCPLTDETRHMIDAAAIAQMPRGSYLVNTARGAIVDTLAVPDALGTGQLAGVGLDVLETEPPPDDHPLVVAWRDADHPAHHRLIINPHAAFYSEQGLLDIRLKTAEACRRALLGQPLRNVVN